MADAVPASDVLCEAMEYLSKLGSNLRTRSDNLKEKRISKDKLKTVHAMKKAASKVLLICELSKKSIENVETGIKKILQRIDPTQDVSTSDGEKSSKQTTDTDHEYINFDCIKLRIPKKVDMKHYTSLKVRVKSMPITMHNKYPVFYDCKLYRLRKNRGNMENESSNNFAQIDQTDNILLNFNASACDPVNNITLKSAGFTTLDSMELAHNGSNKINSQSSNEQGETLMKPIEAEKGLIDTNKSAPSDILQQKVKHQSTDNHARASSIGISEGGLEKQNMEMSPNEKLKYNRKQENEVSETGQVTSKNTKLNNVNCHRESVSSINYNVRSCDREKDVLGNNSISDTECDPSLSKSNIKSNIQGNNGNSPENNLVNEEQQVLDASPSFLPEDVQKIHKENLQSDEDTNNLTKKVSKKSSSIESDKSFCTDTSKTRLDKPKCKFPKSKSKSVKRYKHINVVNDSSDSEEIIECSNITTIPEKSLSDMKNSGKDCVDFNSTKNLNLNGNNYLNENGLSFYEEEKSVACSNSVSSEQILQMSSQKENCCEEKVDSNSCEIEKSKKMSDETQNKKNNHSNISESLDPTYTNNRKNKMDSNKEDHLNDLESDNAQEKIRITSKDNEGDLSTVNDLDDRSSKLNSENDDSRPSTDSRPYIRCISIDKLMKNKNDSVMGNTESKKAEGKSKKESNVESICKIEKFKFFEEHKKSPKKHRDKSKKSKSLEGTEDDVYWEQKRKERKSFKDKKFVIKLNRLPELTKDYLYTHNLKKITKNGLVITEIIQEFKNQSDNKNSNDNLEKEFSEETVIPADIHSAKNALLDDSDSEKSRDLVTTPKKVKNICKESELDSGENQSEKCPALVDSDSNHIEKSKTDNKILQSDFDMKTRINKTPEPVKDILDVNEINNIKSPILHDSLDDDKTPTKNKKISDSTPPSKRRRIMESMHAKKMLLTYSSSDTEDEELGNVLKQIKDSLLKEILSDEDKETKKNRIDEPTSDSEGSSIEIRKRKKHNRSTDTTASESKISKRDKAIKIDYTVEKTSEIDGKTEEKSNDSSQKMGRYKPIAGGSSSHNSDTQESYDKDIDGLTNLKTLNKKHRRRGSTSTDRTQSSSRTLKKMPKVPQISEEGFLKAEDSSDEPSMGDSDVGEEVELPAVPMTDLNGDSIGHLAKNDLLEESDSSSSQNKSLPDVKPDGDSDDDTVKSKRRKGHATISSDSEAGGSRKKDHKVKFSDFEDSEDESSETGKRSKRKKKEIDSDASAGSSIDGKKKRRRIKNIDDSEASGSESENEGRNKHGRKNIRKVMSKNQLEEATKKAAREEKERIARIAERQKLYNNLEFDESGKPDEVVLDKVVLDFDPETKEPLIEVDKGLVKKLKPHQANGIKFMWDACFESVKRIKKDKGSGCILAHCMGLGKTLQVVSLTHTLLTHSELTGVNRVLVVCPLSTVLNWVNEFKIWLKHAEADYEVDLYELSRFKQNSERAWQLQHWFSDGGVCVLGYEMFRNLSADNTKKFKKKMLKSFQESLVNPGPDLVVCDEGHLLKNEKTSLSQAMNRVKTHRRIVLTGTPLQNNLKEYYCMVQFVKPNLLGKYNEYLNRFVNPITNGQYTDSTEHDIRVMKRRSHVLHKMLDGAVQRRDYGVLAPFLPPKHEYVLFITLTEVQIKLYQHYLDNYSRRPLAGKSSGFLFPDFQSLQRIWTHPLVLKYNSERYEIMQQKKREREEEDSEGSLVDFINDDSTPEESTSEELSDSLSDMSDDSRKKSKKKKATKKAKKTITRRGTRANPVEAEEDVIALDSEIQTKTENPTEWWMSLVSEDELEDLRHSHKLVLLFDILRQCETIGDKLLVFSQSLYSLDLIEHFLEKVDEATQEGRVDEKLNGHVGSWSPGVDYFRLDGSTSCENRSIWCKNFNREDNPRARLFLISTRAGGLGINLVAANRVIIFDVSWNPSHDVQSIFRVYRFGQKKPCYIYRFLAMGTMEEKIYERQVTKQAISKRVIDEQQIDRHYAENDLAELYKFEPTPPTPRQLPSLPKDRLFAEMLKEYEAQIYKYHEHDSLLENKEEETLTEEERKAAWEDFENEKTRPPPVPFNAYNMHNGMMPGLMQQQQLAFAALGTMLRKDMPNITDDQIRNMMPLIFNSNPGLMQKMSEIYKYAQPGMMNPAMMNPVMNPAGGMAVGGSSGLQYEPPWQRQQQQQHQMRLQQLMQQQQNMGAKYYAGGLGSRDPVAMALQQQRAREMMLGERGRPRGRPPAPPPAHRPRVPPHAPDAVVNLDSD